MTTHAFRITVRGYFVALTQAQRDELLAEADLSYDLSAREAFAFRFLETGEEEADVIDATERAEGAAVAWLTHRGYGFKNLRSQAVDLALAPLSKRQRQAAASGR